MSVYYDKRKGKENAQAAASAVQNSEWTVMAGADRFCCDHLYYGFRGQKLVFQPVSGPVCHLLSGSASQYAGSSPDTRVVENGIWFRDYNVMIPYSYMEKGEFYKGRSHGSTDYVVDIFLSSKVFEDGQLNTCKLQKKLKGENRIWVLLEDQEEEYVSLCTALQGKVPMRDVSGDDASE